MSSQQDNWRMVIDGTSDLGKVNPTEIVGIFLWTLAACQLNSVVHQARFSSTNYPVAGEINAVDPNDKDRWAAVFAAVPTVNLNM
jgi:hypothetical protein